MATFPSDPEQQKLGLNGRIRIDQSDVPAGSNSFEGVCFSVKAITGDFTYGVCVAERGDAPTEDDALVQGDTDFWPGTTVVAKTGAAWIYPIAIQPAN